MPRIDDPWIGSAIATPELGAPFAIARPGSTDLQVTAPVIRLLPRRDGLLVDTTRGRYVVGIAGDTYLVTADRDDVEAGRCRRDRAVRPHRTRLQTLSLAIGLSLIMLAIGCDESADHGGDPDAAAMSTCKQIAMVGCAKACDCDPAVACVLSYSGGVLTVKHDDPGACTRFASYVCESSATSETDKQSCLQALEPVQCTTTTHDGTQYGALPVPTVCKDVL